MKLITDKEAMLHHAMERDRKYEGKPFYHPICFVPKTATVEQLILVIFWPKGIGQINALNDGSGVWVKVLVKAEHAVPLIEVLIACNGAFIELEDGENLL